MLFRRKNVVEESAEEMEILSEEPMGEKLPEENPEILFEEPAEEIAEEPCIEPETDPFADIDIGQMTSQMEEKIKEEMQEEDIEKEESEVDEKFKDVTKSFGYPKTIKDLIFVFGSKRKKRIKLVFVDENGQKRSN